MPHVIVRGDKCIFSRARRLRVCISFVRLDATSVVHNARIAMYAIANDEERVLMC